MIHLWIAVMSNEPLLLLPYTAELCEVCLEQSNTKGQVDAHNPVLS